MGDGVITSLHTPLSALRAAKDGIAASEANIMRSHELGVAAQDVTFNYDETGVHAQITSKLDPRLTKASLTKNSEVKMYETMLEYYTRLLNELGNPADGGSLKKALDTSKSKLIVLANDPTDRIAQGEFVKTLRDTTNQFNSLSKHIQDLRSQTNLEIKEGVKTVQEKLKIVADLNAKIAQGSNNNENISPLLQTRKDALDVIAGYLDITTNDRGDGKISVMTLSGTNLLEESPATLEFTSGKVFHAMSYEKGDLSGIMVDGKDVAPLLRHGKLKALLDMRDKDLVRAAEQLDETAQLAFDALNKIHNRGSSYPARGRFTSDDNTYTGATAFTGTGKTRIAAVSKTGEVVNFVEIDLATVASVDDILAKINTNGNGNVAPNSSFDASIVNGKIIIKAKDELAYGIAINEMDSKIGVDGKGFSHFFGFNNLLKAQIDPVLNPSLSNTIEVDPRFLVPEGHVYLSVGTLDVKADIGKLGITESGKSDDGLVLIDRMAKALEPSVDYSNEFLSTISQDSALTKSRRDVAKTTKTSLDEQIANKTGINKDEQFKNIETYRNLFAAVAKVLTVRFDMNKETLGIFR